MPACRSLIQVERRALPTAPLCFPIHAKSISFVTSVHEETGRCPINDSLIQSGEKSISTSSDVLFTLRRSTSFVKSGVFQCADRLWTPENGHSSRVERALPTAPSASLSLQRALIHNLRLGPQAELVNVLLLSKQHPRCDLTLHMM